MIRFPAVVKVFLSKVTRPALENTGLLSLTATQPRDETNRSPPHNDGITMREAISSFPRVFWRVLLNQRVGQFYLSFEFGFE
jgi:hypothetical protein